MKPAPPVISVVILRLYSYIEVEALIPTIFCKERIISPLVFRKKTQRPGQPYAERRCYIPTWLIKRRTHDLLCAATGLEFPTQAPGFAIGAEVCLVPLIVIGRKEAGRESRILREDVMASQEAAMEQETSVVMQSAVQNRAAGQAAVIVAPPLLLRLNG